MQLFTGHLKEDKGNYSIVVVMQIEGKKKWAQWSTGLPIRGNKTYAKFLLDVVVKNLHEVNSQTEYAMFHHYIQNIMFDTILHQGFQNRLTPRSRKRLEKFKQERDNKQIKDENESVQEISDEVIQKSTTSNSKFQSNTEKLEHDSPCYKIYCGIDHPEFTLTSHSKFYKFFEVWIKYILPSEVRPTTFSKTKSVLKHRDIPFFRERGYRLCDIDDRILRDYYDRMGKGMTVEGNYYRPLKKQSIHTHHTYIKMALDFAVEHSILKYNPAHHVVIKQKNERKAKTTYTLEELNQLFQIVHGKSCEYSVLMAAYYGLRRSEILGLQ